MRLETLAFILLACTTTVRAIGRLRLRSAHILRARALCLLMKYADMRQYKNALKIAVERGTIAGFASAPPSTLLAIQRNTGDDYGALADGGDAGGDGGGDFDDDRYDVDQRTLGEFGVSILPCAQRRRRAESKSLQRRRRRRRARPCLTSRRQRFRFTVLVRYLLSICRHSLTFAINEHQKRQTFVVAVSRLASVSRLATHPPPVWEPQMSKALLSLCLFQTLFNISLSLDRNAMLTLVEVFKHKSFRSGVAMNEQLHVLQLHRERQRAQSESTRLSLVYTLNSHMNKLGVEAPPLGLAKSQTN